MLSDAGDLNRDPPDGFPRLPTMAAQRAYQHESGFKLDRTPMEGWADMAVASM